jgi:hypothetical protein
VTRSRWWRHFTSVARSPSSRDALWPRTRDDPGERQGGSCGFATRGSGGPAFWRRRAGLRAGDAADEAPTSRASFQRSAHSARMAADSSGVGSGPPYQLQASSKAACRSPSKASSVINADTLPPCCSAASAFRRRLVAGSTETLNVFVAPARRARFMLGSVAGMSCMLDRLGSGPQASCLDRQPKRSRAWVA